MGEDQHWSVHFIGDDDKQIYKEFTLHIRNERPNLKQFKNDIAKHFGIRGEFYFKNHEYMRVLDEDIVNKYNKNNPILSIHQRGTRKFYKFTVQSIPSTQFKEYQTIRYDLRSALCEFIDNSIQYTIGLSPRQINTIVDIKKNMISIRDNGVGMNSEELQLFAKLAEKRFSESNTAEYVLDAPIPGTLSFFKVDTVEQIMAYLPNMFISFLSKWGTGAKLAMEALGVNQTVISKKSKEKVISVIKLRRGNKEWKIDTDQVPASNTPEIQSQFTQFSISELIIDRNTNWKTELEPLEHIYYFYLNSWSTFFKVLFEISNQHAMCQKKLQLERFIGKFEHYQRQYKVDLYLNSKLLRSNEILKQYQRACSMFPIYFTFSLPAGQQNTVDDSEGKFFKHVVIGFLFYFPYDASESVPDSIRSEYYWVGRLLPEEDLVPYFMEEKNCKKVRDSLVRRTKGIFFLNRAFVPNPEKTRLLKPGESKEILKEKYKDKKLSEKYQEWINDCHSLYDREIHFSIFISQEAVSSQVCRMKYKQMETMEKTIIQNNDLVKLTNSRKTRKHEDIIGNVCYFQYLVGPNGMTDYKVCINRRTFITFVDQHYLLDDYTITKLERTPQLDKALQALKPKSMGIFQVDKTTKLRPTPRSATKSIKGNTTTTITLRVYLFDRYDKTLDLSDYKVDWELCGNESDQSLPSGQDIQKSTKYYFVIEFSGHVTPRLYDLRIKVYIPQQDLKNDQFEISQLLTVEIDPADIKELRAINIPEEIQLGEPFVPPSLTLIDITDMACDWSDFIRKEGIHPRLQIVNPAYRFASNIQCKENGIALEFLPLQLEMNSKYYGTLATNNTVTLEYTILDKKCLVRIPVVAGNTAECALDTPQSIENFSLQKFKITPLDRWKNPNSEDLLSFQSFEGGLRSCAMRRSALEYFVESELFTYYPKAHDTAPIVELLSDPVIDSIKHRKVYYAFSVDGVCYQTGDFFKTPKNRHQLPEAYGMVLYAYTEESEPGIPYFDYLYVYSPFAVETKHRELFKAYDWDPQELCLCDHICEQAKISKDVHKPIRVLSHLQFQKYRSHFPRQDERVYFIRRLFSLYQLNASLPPIIEMDTISPLERSNAFYIYVYGSKFTKCFPNDPAKLYAVFRGYEESCPMRNYIHPSSFQWTLQGSPIDISSFDFRVMRPGSLFCYVPIRAMLNADTNETISLRLEHSKDHHIVSHSRIALLPSSKPSLISLSVCSQDIVFDTATSTLKGVGGSDCTLLIRVENEEKMDFTPQLPGITIIDDHGRRSDVIHGKITLTIPKSLQQRPWIIEVPYNNRKIRREINIKTLIGPPATIVVTRVTDNMNRSVSMDQRSPCSLQCGLEYTLHFTVYDKNNQPFEKHAWQAQCLEFVSYTCEEIQKIGAMTTDVEITNLSLQKFPPYCNIRIITTEGALGFIITACTATGEQIKSPPFEANITPGNPHKVNLIEEFYLAKQFEKITLEAQVFDCGGNPVHRNDVQVFLKSNRSQVPKKEFTQKGSWYSLETSFEEINTYSIEVAAKTINRKYGRGLDIEPHVITIKVDPATHIAYDIKLSDFSLSIVAGTCCQVSATVVTQSGAPLPNIKPTLTIRTHDRIYAIDEPLTKTGEYQLHAEIDKDFTLTREPKIVAKRFKVTAGPPTNLQLEPMIQSNTQLPRGKWLWDNRICVSLIDQYGNICEQIGSNKFECLMVNLKNIENDEDIFTKSYTIQKGSVTIGRGEFMILELRGCFSLNFSCQVEDSQMIKTFDFAINADTSRRALQNQAEHLQKEIQAKQRQLADEQRKREFSNEKVSKYKKRIEVVNNLLVGLNKQREIVPKKLSFQETWEIIQSMAVYRRYKAAFLGNVASLGYIGNLESNWTTERMTALNKELTHWIGERTLRNVVITGEDTPNPRSLEVRIISDIKEEVRDKRLSLDVRQLEPYERNRSQHPQQHIPLPSIHSEGFLGYAVNLLFMDEEMLRKRIRERLWKSILRETVVFDTQQNLLNYCYRLDVERDQGRGHRNKQVHGFTLDGFQRRGLVSTIIGSETQRSFDPAFATPPNSSQRKALLDEQLNIQEYLEEENQRELKISQLEAELEKLYALKNQMAPSDPAHSSESRDPRKRNVEVNNSQGLQAEGFGSPTTKISGNKRPMPRRKTVAKRGRPR